MTRTVRCCFDGCRATSEHPLTDGWMNIVDWATVLQTDITVVRTPTHLNRF
jgi:hypothetical protein